MAKSLNRKTNMPFMSCYVLVLFSLLAPACTFTSRSESYRAGQSTGEPQKPNKSQALQGPNQFLYTQYFDRYHWLVADQNGLWKTTDTGRTWSLSFTSEPKKGQRLNFGGMSFFSAQMGFLIYGKMLYQTDDGGVSWKEIGAILQSGEDHHFENCFFVDSMHGWAVGHVYNRAAFTNPKIPLFEGLVVATSDGGKTWQRQRLNLPKSHPNKSDRWSLFNVFFRNERIGWLVGDLVIFWTVDGGQSWHLAQTSKGDYKGRYKEVNFLDDQFGWVTISEAVDILITSDGGRHWKTVLGPTPNLGQLRIDPVFLTPQHGLATIEDLYETTDGGRSWKKRMNICDDKRSGILARASDGSLIIHCYKNDSPTAVISMDNGESWQSRD